MKSDWIGLAQFIFAFGASVFAVIKITAEYLKSQVEKVRLKSIDADAIKSLIASSEKFEIDIAALQREDIVRKEDLDKLEHDVKEIIREFLKYQINKHT